MKCKYCHAEVENDAIFCPNCGKQLPQRKQCIRCGEILDEESEFCPKCGTQQSREASTSPQNGRYNAPVRKEGKSSFSNPWVLLAMFVLLLLLLFLLFNPFGNNSKKADKDDLLNEELVDKENPNPVDSDSIFRAKATIEQQQKEDSLMKVAKTKSDSLAFIKDSLNNLKDKKTAKTQVVQSATPSDRSNGVRPSRTVQTGTKNLGYGSYKGNLVGGKPHGVNGRLVFKTYHQIDSRDPKGRMADPGDYVIGEFYDGHLVQGIWYDANNQVKGSIIIGR